MRLEVRCLSDGVSAETRDGGGVYVIVDDSASSY